MPTVAEDRKERPSPGPAECSPDRASQTPLDRRAGSAGPDRGLEKFPAFDPLRVTLTVIDNPMAADPRRVVRHTKTIQGATRPLIEILPEQCQAVTPKPDWIVIENGKVIPPDEWAMHLAIPGGEIICYPRVHGGIGKLLLGIAIITAAVLLQQYELLTLTQALGVGLFGAGLVVGGASEMLVGAPQMPNIPTLSMGDQSSSPTFGFGGIQNSTRLGAPIGVLYGTQRVGGQYVALSVETQDDNDVLHALIAVSEGEVSGPVAGGILINGQPVANYRNVTTATKNGTNNQTAVSLFGDKTTTTISADAAISNASLLTYTTLGTNLNGFEVELVWPQGLFAVNPNDGSLEPNDMTVTLDYRLTSGASLSWTNAGTFTFKEAKRSVLRRQLRVDGLAAGRYDIRLYRGDAERIGPNVYNPVRRSTVNEIVADNYLYPNVALLAVEAMATDQLSGGMPTITSIWQGRLLRVLSSVSAYTTIYSSNPAWVVLDMLTNVRYGMGRFTWPTEYNAGSITLTNGSTTVGGVNTLFVSSGKVRAGQKLVVDSLGVILTVAGVTNEVNLVLSAPWGGASASGLAYELHRDDLDLQSFIDWAAFCDVLVSDGNGGMEKRATCDIVFDADNQKLWDAVLKICGLGLAMPVKLGNYLKIKIEQAVTPVQLFTMANIVKGSFREVFMPLKERANVFELQYLNAANDYQQDMVVLEDPLIYSNSEPVRKQAVSVYGVTRTSHAARLAKFYQLANRYLTRTISFEVGLDAVTAEPGDVIRFQHDVPQWGFGGRAASGSTASTIVLDRSVTIAPSTSYQIVVRHSADDTVETFNLNTAAGTVSTLTIAGVWTTIPAKGDVYSFGQLNVAVKPFRIIAIQRTPDLTAKITALEYNAAIYDESGLTPVNVVNYSVLTDIVGPPGPVLNLTILQLSGPAITLYVSFTPPGSLNYKTARIYRNLDGVDVFLGESRTGGFPIAGVLMGDTVTVKVTTLSTSGQESSVASAPTASLLVAVAAPPDVTNFSSYYLNGITSLNWTAVVWVAPIEYEIRKGSTWAAAIVLGRLPSPITRIPAAGDGTYWIAARDDAGNYSANPASLVVTGSFLTNNVVATLDESGSGWPGTVTPSAQHVGGVIELVGAGLWDSIPDIDACTDIDFYGGVGASGIYEIAAGSIVDLGTVKPVAISYSYTAHGDSLIALFDSIADVDLYPDIDGNFSGSVDVIIQVAISDGAGVFGVWQNLVPGEYSGRKFKFRAILESSDTTITCVLSALSFTVDMPDLIQAAAGVALAAGGTTIMFPIPFQTTPSIQVTILGATSGDTENVIAQSGASANLQILNGGVGVGRTVNWVAKGY